MRRMAIIVFGLAVLCAFENGLWADNAPVLPRYHFRVGLRLNYSGESHFTGSNPVRHEESWQLTVLAASPDGSYRVLIRHRDLLVTENDKSQTRPDAANESVDYCGVDIMPDGRVISILGGFMPEVPSVLPTLPGNQNELDETWKKEPRAVAGESEVFHAVPAPDNSRWNFASSEESVFKLVYGRYVERSYQFDLARGLVASIDSRWKEDNGAHESGTGLIHFDSDEMLSSEQATLSTKDAELLLTAESDWEDKTDQIGASDSPFKAIGMAKSAKANLVAAAAKVSIPEIKSQFDQMLGQMDQDVEIAFFNAGQISSATGKPLLDIAANDSDGRPHKLSDYRGKVIVLDFWYRDCPWCLLAMPNLKQIAQEFKDKPVVVLGMNIDPKPEDAQFVINAMKLNYLNLRIDHNIAGQFGVMAYPTLMVIDANGIIRDFQVGYSPTLLADTERKINEAMEINSTSTRPTTRENQAH